MQKEMLPIKMNKKPWWRKMLGCWEMYLFVLPALIYLAIFAYGPMGGLIIAFKNYKPFQGILGSQWVGLYHFERLFGMKKFFDVFRNTVSVSLYSIIAGFIFPVILALALNSCRHNRFKRIVQTVTYAPHFISIVVIVSMINVFFSPSIGVIANIKKAIGLGDAPIGVLMSADAFPHLYVWSGIWTELGWDSIIYLGALTSIDPSLHEAAMVDGASKSQRIWHIDIPGILPTMIVLLILRCGKVMSVGFEKVYLMQNSMNITSSEIISTYVYKLGLQQTQYSFATAVGLFNSVINFAILLTVNKISSKVSETSLF